MKFRVVQQETLQTDADCIVLALAPNTSYAEAQKTVLTLHAPAARNALKAHKSRFAKNSSLTLHYPEQDCPSGSRALHLFALPETKNRDQQWRSLGAFLATLAKSVDKIALDIRALSSEDTEMAARRVLQAAEYCAYQFSRYKTKEDKDEKNSKASIEFHISQSSKASTLRAALTTQQCSNAAVSWARDLVHTPAGDLGPKEFYSELRSTLKGAKQKIHLTALRKSQLEKLGAGAILGVAQGSASEPLLLHLRYVPATNKRRGPSKPLVLVGKGVTFDSGGLSIKSSSGMVDMKCDMAGAAAVAGVFYALSILPKASLPQIEIHGLIPLVENMISAHSIRPGDILNSLSGKTIEVLNTDAEGRLILADALHYAERLTPSAIIDLATLTGACISALGEHFAGLFTEDTQLADQLLCAAKHSGDSLWQLPLAADAFGSLLKSDIADIKNSAGVPPGASLAALFLQEFVPKDVPWAHLDIAGPAYLSKPAGFRQKGASGFGISLLLEYVSSLQAS